ncbi:MAG TPA: porin family protein [Anaeromyxobacteraceae bacterium]|nr:porin family protein [Anaeromyxobacteraceae bacterium]
MRKMLAALAAVVAMPLAAHAAPTVAAPGAFDASTSPYYVTAKVGAYLPNSDDLDGFNNGFSSEVQVGRRINPNLAAELGLGWFATSTDEVLGNKLTISVVPLTATAKGILPFGDAELYGLGGVGAYFGRAKLETTDGNISDTETSFGFHLGAGAQYALTSQLSVGLEGRYVIAELSDVSMNGFLLNGGVAFRF